MGFFSSFHRLFLNSHLKYTSIYIYICNKTSGSPVVPIWSLANSVRKTIVEIITMMLITMKGAQSKEQEEIGAHTRQFPQL